MGLWYALLARYIEKKPDEKTIHIFLSKQPSLAEKADDVVKSMNRLRESGKAVEILERVADEIV
jgi:hypothetical protein